MAVESSSANSDDLAGRLYWTHSELAFGEKQIIPALQQLFLVSPKVNQSVYHLDNSGVLP
jgi:hypothetical protein